MNQRLPLSKGDAVVVSGLGLAVVVKPTLAGAMVAIRENGLLLDLPWSKIRSLEKDNGSAPSTQISELTHARLRALEALRFGLVPQSMLNQFTLGYSDLSAWVGSSLSGLLKNKPVICEVRGPFGTGKSHTVALVRHIAEQQGYLHARVEVDGQNVSFSSPGVFLQILWATLKGKGFEPEYPMLDLYLRALQASPTAAASAVEYLMTTRDNLESVRKLRQYNVIEQHGQLLEGLLTGSEEHTGTSARDVFVRNAPILKGQVNLVPVMSRKLFDRPGCLVESLVGTALLAVVAGYKGLVVTVDEFEVEYVDVQRLKLVREVVAALREYFENEHYLPSAPLSIFFATVGAGASGDEIIDGLVKVSGGSHHLLRQWNDQQLLELSKKLHELYRNVYGLAINWEPVIAGEALKMLKGDDDITSGIIRGYIKLYIGLLDIKYGPPNFKR